MAESSVFVRAPGRLHFGMFSFGVPTLRQYGGAGVMVDRYATELRITPSDRFECVGRDAGRVRQVLESVRATDWGRDLPPCRLDVAAAPPAHVGLGSGTQSALAVVAGLRCAMRLPPLDVVELAQTAGRAKRSPCLARASHACRL